MGLNISGWVNNIQGAYHQLNPFDKGRTYDTNRRGVETYAMKQASGKSAGGASGSWQGGGTASKGGSGGGGGGYYGGGGSYQAPDPYAKWGGRAGYDQAVADYNSLRGTTFGSIDRATADSETPYRSGILDYLDTAKQQRRNLDTRYVQTEAARQQGQQGVLSMVGNGIKQGGVVITNAGGGTSSAAEQLAKGYGALGRSEASAVNNQAETELTGIRSDEQNFNEANQSQIRKTNESKINTVNSIVNSAVTQLAALNEKAAGSSLPDRVNIEGEAARIKQQALDALTKYDNELSGGIAALTPKDSNTVRSEARGMLQAGVVPESEFDYTSEVPAELQGTGDFASSLPIFLSPNRKQEQQPAVA